MSQCVVPNWNLRHQQIEEEEEGKKSSHVHRQHPNFLGLMSNYEVTELTWENGQLAMHGLVPNSPIKPIWTQPLGDTLESIVHQATYHKENPNFIHYNEKPINIDSLVASSGGKWAENSSKIQIMGPECVKKRSRSDSSPYQRHYCSSNVQEELGDQSACASASATFCRPENDTTMMTWTSFESPRSLKTRTTMDGDEDLSFRRELGNDPEEEERETKAETGRSHSIKRSRAADVHNQSERRRRDRINQKMKALQRLVPNSSKTDKASMLDEVIAYLKQLKAQIQMMSVRNMPQMMMPLGMQQQQQQQQLQMSLLARMGMTMGLGMGMGLFDVNAVGPTNPHPISPLLHPNPMAAATTPTFVPPFLVPSMIPTHPTAPSNPDPVPTQPVSMNDPFYYFMAQSMNMELYNQMTAELYRQQVNQKAQAMSNPLTGEPRPS